MGLKRGWLAAVAAGVIVAACDGGASAVQTREEAAASPRPLSESGDGAAGERVSASGADREDAPRFNGKPMWSANRRFTAEQNARRNFDRNGEDFGAGSVKDYVAKAHAFVSDPPAGAQTLKRENGDRLIYDPAGNVFAVADREGAPRTMFKPDEGPAYWTRVKEQEAAGPRRRRDRGEGSGASEG